MPNLTLRPPVRQEVAEPVAGPSGVSRKRRVECGDNSSSDEEDGVNGQLRAALAQNIVKKTNGDIAEEVGNGVENVEAIEDPISGQNNEPEDISD